MKALCGRGAAEESEVENAALGLAKVQFLSHLPRAVLWYVILNS